MKLPQSPFFKKKLREKVHDAVWEDKRKYGLSALTTPAARKVVEDCTGRCDNCDCELLFNGWQPWCLHQFSLDRVDLTKPHGPENMRVLCYSCNAQIATTRDPEGLIMKVECPKMSCKSGCHVGSARPCEALLFGSDRNLRVYESCYGGTTAAACGFGAASQATQASTEVYPCGDQT